MVRKILKSVREFWKSSVITMVFIVLEAVIETFLPFITAQLINDIKKGVEVSELWQTGILLIVLAFVSLACAAIAGFHAAKASAGFCMNLRNDMFHQIQSFSFENIDKFSSASLVTRITTDVFYVRMSYMMVIRTAIRSPLMFIFSVIMAYIMGGVMVLPYVLVIPIIISGLLLISKKAMPAFRKVFKEYDKLNESVEENVRAVRVVKGFAREEFEKEKFHHASDNIRQNFTRAERIIAFNNPLVNGCLYIIMVSVLFFGSMIAIKSGGVKLDVGNISSLVVYGVQILMSLMMLSMIYVIINMSIESMRRIYEVLMEKSTLTNPVNPIYEVKNGDIEFIDVNFKYAQDAIKYSLANVNLKIASGETVGILGTTGSSKSTLVQLIPRLYDTTTGEVLVGGINVKDYDLVTLRDKVAFVLQKNELFSGTIAENLRWGNPEATMDEIIEACKLAQADEFIKTFPDKYETKIEQGGINVSGGQKQRLCIARALLKKPMILILDDSTSAVDTKTDALMREGFRNYIPHITKIIIAQRVASVEDADKIIIMDNGEISAIGTHEELLQTSPIYKETYEQQRFGGGKTDE